MIVHAGSEPTGVIASGADIRAIDVQNNSLVEGRGIERDAVLYARYPCKHRILLCRQPSIFAVPRREHFNLLERVRETFAVRPRKQPYKPVIGELENRQTARFL